MGPRAGNVADGHRLNPWPLEERVCRTWEDQVTLAGEGLMGHRHAWERASGLVWLELNVSGSGRGRGAVKVLVPQRGRTCSGPQRGQGPGPRQRHRSDDSFPPGPEGPHQHQDECHLVVPGEQ